MVAGGLTFPEAPRWHDGALWVSDMHAHAVLRLEPSGTLTTVAEVPGCPSGLGFLPDGRMLVVSMHDRRVMRLDPDGLREHADLSGLAPWHCNDMAVDANGRAYVGNFGDDSAPPAPPAPTVLIAVEPDGQARVVADELMFPNGIAVSDGGETLVVAETRSVPGRTTSHQIPNVMSFLPRRRASACKMRTSVAPDSGLWVVTAQRGTGAMARSAMSPIASCPLQPCSAQASAPVTLIVMRNRRGSGVVPPNSAASACSDASDISVTG